MLMKMYQVSFFVTLVMGTTIACSANSWFTCWLGLEINLMSLIPLLIIKLTPLSSETAIKYFLAQAMASLTIIFSSLTDSSLTLNNFMSTTNEIILIALAISAGMAPFHFWFPQVMKISNWAQCLVILTWQKIAPFVLILSLSTSLMTLALVSVSATVGSLGGLNQMNLKMIMTYSSIAHSAWMLSICAAASVTSWALYFLIYSVISISIILILYKLNTNMISQLMTPQWNNNMKVSFMVTMMSLGGLPPLLGFIAKLSAVQLIVMNLSASLAVVLILSSLISLFYYLRVIYFLILSTSKMNLIFTQQKQSMPIFTLVMCLGGNLAAPLMALLA